MYTCSLKDLILTIWVHLTNIMLTGRSQTSKRTYCMWRNSSVTLQDAWSRVGTYLPLVIQSNANLGTAVKEFCGFTVPKQWTLRQGDYPGEAWPGQVSSFKAEHVLWLLAEEEVRVKAWGRLTLEKFSVTGLNVEEALWQGTWVASSCWEWPLVESQQENGDLSPTTTRKWILSTTSELWRGTQP